MGSLVQKSDIGVTNTKQSATLATFPNDPFVLMEKYQVQIESAEKQSTTISNVNAIKNMLLNVAHSFHEHKFLTEEMQRSPATHISPCDSFCRIINPRKFDQIKKKDEVAKAFIKHFKEHGITTGEIMLCFANTKPIILHKDQYDSQTQKTQKNFYKKELINDLKEFQIYYNSKSILDNIDYCERLFMKYSIYATKSGMEQFKKYEIKFTTIADLDKKMDFYYKVGCVVFANLMYLINKLDLAEKLGFNDDLWKKINGK